MRIDFTSIPQEKRMTKKTATHRNENEHTMAHSDRADNPRSSAFEKTYKSALHANETASEEEKYVKHKKEAENTLSQSHSSKGNATMSAKTKLDADQTGYSDKQSILPWNRECSKEEQAEGVIREAIASISSLLNLTIKNDFASFSIDSAKEATLDSISEVLLAIKTIAQMLDLSAIDNGGIEIHQKFLGANECRNLSSVLRNEQFRIEIGLQTLGIAENVYHRVNEKMNRPSVGGIIQATAPDEISMPMVHSKHIFDSLFENAPPEIKEIIQKIMEMANEKKGTVEKLPASDPQWPSMIPENAAVVEGKKPPNVSGKTPMHNFDGTPPGQNKGEAKPAIPLQKNVVDDSGPVPSAIRNMNANVLSEKNGEIHPESNINDDGVSDGFSFKMVQSSEIKDVRLANALHKLPDESVTRQVSEKIHTAVRAGVNEVRIQLRPESLGEVHLSIRVESEVVMARIQVENQQVKQILENNLQLLKDALAQQNLQAGNIDVHVGGNMEQQANEGAWGMPQSDSAKVGTHVHADNENDGDYGKGAIFGHDTGRRFGNNTIEYFI